MIRPLKTILEDIEKFNNHTKYIKVCDFCNNSIVYTKNECQNNTIKCPYCGHTQVIHYLEEYPVRIHLKYEDNPIMGDFV